MITKVLDSYYCSVIILYISTLFKNILDNVKKNFSPKKF